MANWFTQFFRKESADVVGVDIGSSAIKVIQLGLKGGRAQLKTYGSLALGPYAGKDIGTATNLSKDKLKEAVGDILHEANVSTQNAGIAIPFSASLMSFIEVPDINREKLEEIVPNEAKKYIPVPISDVTLDWSVIPRDEYDTDKNGADKTDVLLVAIHNETLDKYRDIVDDARLEAGFLEIEVFSTMRSVLEENTRPVMIFDMGASSTKLYVVDRGVVRTSHRINRGSQDITHAISKSLGVTVAKAERMKREHGIAKDSHKDLSEIVSLVLNYIFTEAKQVLERYEDKFSRKVDTVIMVGGGSVMKGVSDKARQTFKAEVVASDPFSKVQAPAFMDEVFAKIGPEFAVAMGLALRRLKE